jgi:hypothetical protein
VHGLALVAHYHQRAVAARCALHATARMRSCAAHINAAPHKHAAVSCKPITNQKGFSQNHNKPKRLSCHKLFRKEKGAKGRVLWEGGATCAAQVQALQRGTMHAVAWRRPAGEKNVGAMHDKTNSVVNWLR